MRLRLKTKITLIIALLVLAVVGRQFLALCRDPHPPGHPQADSRANLVAQQVFFQAQNALADAATEGQVPTSE